MTVKSIMTPGASTCTPETTAAEAARLMWERDCGILPVVVHGMLRSVVTDRDLFIALATRNERAADLLVGDVAVAEPLTCSPDDDVRMALAVMMHARVRRLPVIDAAGALQGMLSLSDVWLASGPGTGIHRDDVADTQLAIAARRAAVPAVVTA